MTEGSTTDFGSVTPADMARELGVEPDQVRQLLRRLYPRDEAENGTNWHLDPSQQEAVRRHFASPTFETVDEGWLQFANLAKDVLDQGTADLRTIELDYKEAVRDRVRNARSACMNNDPDWPTTLSRALSTGSNLLHFRTIRKFSDVLANSRDNSRTALVQLWESVGDGRAITDFQEFLRAEDSKLHPGGIVALVSNLLLASMDSAPFKSRGIERFARRVGFALPNDTHDCAARWLAFLELIDRAQGVLASAGVESASRLETQSIIWLISEVEVGDIATGDVARRVRAWRGEDVAYERANRIDSVCEDAGWRLLRGGLLGEPSPLTGSASVWTGENARELIRRIYDEPLRGSGKSFHEKLEEQLDGASPEVVQLLAEIQMVRQLPTAGIKLRGATDALAFYSSFAGEQWLMPDWLESAMSHDVFGGGNRFNQDQWLHIALAAQVVEAWDELDEAEREQVLASPWELLDFLENVGGHESGQKHMRMVMCYLAWPNYFHPIISSKHIGKIRAAFKEFLPERRGDRNSDIQRDLYDIQQGLEARHGGPVNFYVSPYVDEWQPGVGPDELPSAQLEFAERATNIADRVHMEPVELARIGRVIENRRQVVFYGPPGTGKTFVARALAAELAGEDSADAVRLVQFHPSYSYEDFFEGFRPVESDGTAAFTLQPGPLRRLAVNAKNNSEMPHFLIIDEMNRGNLAKIFGELYFLLEYRDQEVFLQYSPDSPFTLPDNLFIIGTMNTTDRSIGLVDAAIRRRFAFIEFHPESSPVEGVLERYLEANGYPSDRASLMRSLNARIGEHDLRIGPSYLMRKMAQDSVGLEDVWEYDILPLLFEHFHGRKSPADVRREFALETLRAESGTEV